MGIGEGEIHRKMQFSWANMTKNEKNKKTKENKKK